MVDPNQKTKNLAMNFGITEDYTQTYCGGIRDTDGTALAAIRALDITPVCFTKKNRDEWVKLFYTETSFGRVVRIEIFYPPKTTFGTCLFLDDPPAEIVRTYGCGEKSYHARVEKVAKELGFSEKGVLAMLHKFALPRDPEFLAKARKGYEVVT